MGTGEKEKEVPKWRGEGEGEEGRMYKEMKEKKIRK
jgi:hypothetical protein